MPEEKLTSNPSGSDNSSNLAYLYMQRQNVNKVSRQIQSRNTLVRKKYYQHYPSPALSMLDFEIKKIRAISNSLNKKETSKEKLTHSLAHLNLQASLFTSRIASDRIAILGQQSERAENSLEEGRQQSIGFSNSNPKTERQSNEKGTQMQYQGSLTNSLKRLILSQHKRTAL